MPADSEFSSHEGREALTLRTLTTAPGASEDGWLPPPPPGTGEQPGSPGSPAGTLSLGSMQPLVFTWRTKAQEPGEWR